MKCQLYVSNIETIKLGLLLGTLDTNGSTVE
jgi:hypothetical protein